MTKTGYPLKGGKKAVSLSDLIKCYQLPFRIAFEESWFYELAEVRSSDRAWFEQIPCRGGAFIAVFSLDPLVLELYTPRPGNGRNIWSEIKSYDGTWSDFHLDQECRIFFPGTPKILNKVAEMADARKRRVLSEEQRAALVERGKAGREALKKWQKERVQAQNLTQIETIPPPARG